jgi:UDP-2,3-diacylglucosamine pyrophosphatase LpxH
MSLESAFALPRAPARRTGSRAAPEGTTIGSPAPVRLQEETSDDEEVASTRYRAIFISDCHLGTPGCQARALLEFLRHTDSDYLYLVGDIVDGWQLKRRWYWHQLHNDVVQKVLRKVRKGTQVIYVPGNHDEAARAYVGIDFGGIAIRAEAVHVTRRGARLLVTHGDLFDAVVTCARWLALVGDHLYTFILKMNQHFNAARARLGLPYWSLSQFLKRRVKNAVSYIASFEEALAREARSRGFDGVVCGHIHHAEIREIGDILYCNSGDWVESLTALVEAQDGTLSIVRWPDTANRDARRGPGSASTPAPAPAPAAIRTPAPEELPCP